jgi:hypothetical protein
VFASNYERWIDRVDNLVIEIHSDEAKAVVLAVLESRGFAISECDELLVGRIL